MKFSPPNRMKVLIISIIFLSTTLFCNVAKAETFTNSFSGVFNFINANIIGQIRKDFCKNYILSISNGEWKKGEFRTNLGKKVCVSYNNSNISGSIALDTLNGNTAVSKKEILSASSINNPTPDVYVTKLTTNNGIDLDINQIINLTNVERKNIDPNLVNLKYNSTLKKIAAVRVKDMFTYQYFEHNSPSGDNASKEAEINGYTYITIGENLALGNFEGSKGVVTAWMNSPGHRANILNKNYTEIGVYAEEGIYKGQNVWIATQIFGKPITGCISPNVTLQNKISNYKVTAESIMTNINNTDEELKTNSSMDNQTYNSKVVERNNLVALYNNLVAEIKSLVAQYNSEVSAFNLCIKTE